MIMSRDSSRGSFGFASLCIYIYIYTYMYIALLVYMNIYICVCTYVCMYIHNIIYTLQRMGRHSAMGPASLVLTPLS